MKQDHDDFEQDKFFTVRVNVYQGFFKENVRYPAWTCRDPISLILGTR